MTTPLPIMAPAAPQWRKRHPKLFHTAIGVACFVVLLAMMAGMFHFIMSIMKSSDAYIGALARARSSPAVIAALGTPVQARYFVTGNIRISGSTGWAQLSVPVSGPKGDATLYVEATKHLGEWQFDHLVVQLAATHERIVLAPAPTLAPPPAPPIELTPKEK